MKKLSCALLLLFLLLLVCSTAFARDWFVSPTGNDATGNGSISSPYATFDKAYQSCQPGDNVQLRAGSYPCNMYFYPNAKSGTAGAPITINSYDGPLQATITSEFFMQAASYLTVTGVAFAVTDTQIVNFCGYEQSLDDYTYPNDTLNHHIQFLNCKFTYSDVANNWNALVKLTQIDYLLMQDCEISVANGTDFCSGAALNLDWDNYCTFRRLYIHDFNWHAVYLKAGSQYSVLEDSVISNGRTSADGQTLADGVAIGGDGTGWDFPNPSSTWGAEYFVARNNIVRGTPKAAFYVSSANYSYIYNNLLADVATYSGGWGDVTTMYFPGPDQGDNAPATHTRVYNNIFLSTTGTMCMAYFDQGSQEAPPGPPRWIS